MDHFLSQLFIKLFLNTQRSTGLLFCDYDVFRIPTVSISCVSSPEDTERHCQMFFILFISVYTDLNIRVRFEYR